ncbi:MAG: cysteine hydrolase [Desulfobacteraceae bacterium]|nr:cysteine hydrolase [Desulfobacteraceae bacterium]
MSIVAVINHDLQYDMVKRNQERINALEDVKPAFHNFLNNIRELDHKVIHMQHINLPDDPKAERYEGGYLPVQKGTPGAEIIKEFLDSRDIVIEKNKDSAFFETNLHEVLQELGVDTVIVTGMHAQICVQTTAADSFIRGYNVWVPEDAIVSARKEDKDRALTWLDGYCATVSTCEEIVSLLKAGKDLPVKKVCTP